MENIPIIEGFSPLLYLEQAQEKQTTVFDGKYTVKEVMRFNTDQDVTGSWFAKLSSPNRADVHIDVTPEENGVLDVKIGRQPTHYYNKVDSDSLLRVLITGQVETWPQWQMIDGRSANL